MIREALGKARAAAATAAEIAGVPNIERWALLELKRRMESATQTPALPAPGQPDPSRAPSNAQLLQSLLEASTEQTQDSARTQLFRAILLSLTPDEARILSALAGGGSYPLITVGAGALLGPASQIVLDNVCTVGKQAGVSLYEQTPLYVSRLRALGLAELGEEDKNQLMKYQLLETEGPLRRACEQIEKWGQKPKLTRRSLRISAFGQDLWNACRPQDQ